MGGSGRDTETNRDRAALRSEGARGALDRQTFQLLCTFCSVCFQVGGGGGTPRVFILQISVVLKGLPRVLGSTTDHEVRQEDEAPCSQSLGEDRDRDE